MSTIPSLATRRSLSLVEPLESRIAPANAFPTVLSIDRETPTAEHTAATSVVFKVTFSDDVTGVDATDFQLFTSGAAHANPTLAVAITPSAKVYNLTVSGLFGNGDVRLDLVDNDTILGQNLNTAAPEGRVEPGIATTVPLGGGGTGNGSFTGETYHLLQTGPNVDITLVSAATSFSPTATWTVTFSEKVTGVDATDFLTDKTGTLAAPNPLTVTPVGTAGTTYTVSTTGLTGTGDITLVLRNDQTIKDVDGNLYQRFRPTFDDAKTTATGDETYAVAVGDVNGDGKPDVISANSVYYDNNFTVALGNGDGTFTTKPLTSSFNSKVAGIAIADVNGDGKPDLIVAARKDLPSASFVSSVSVLLGNGDGTFQAQQNFDQTFSFFPETSAAVTVADMNHDGRPDIVTIVKNQSNQAFVHVLLGNGNGTFQNPTAFQADSNAIAVAVADVDGDGKPDVVTANGTSGNVSILLGTGGGALGAKTNYDASQNAGSLALADVNGDGRPDIVTGSGAFGRRGQNSVTVLLNDPANPGQFPTKQNFSTGDAYDISSVAVADFNGDGKPDIAALGKYVDYDAYSNVTVLSGLGDGSFSPSSTFNTAQSVSSKGFTTGQMAVADFNGDGKSDIAATNPSDDSLSTLINTEPDFYSDTITRGFAGWIVTTPGVAVGKKFAPPIVKVYDRASGELVREFLAYEETYRDSIRVAVADMNGDGVDDIITTTQHNGGRLRVFDGLTGAQFTTGAFGAEIDVFTGKKNGAFVATGDVNGDGQADIITGSALGGGTVKVYNGDRMLTTPTVLKEFMPFGTKFKGGVRVAAAEVSGPTNPTFAPVADIQAFDSSWPMDDLIVGMGYNGGQVKVYDGISDTLLGYFSVGKKGYRGGVSVAAGDINDDGKADLIIGRNSGKPSVVEVFDAATLSPTGVLPTQLGKTINPFDKDPLKPKNIYGVRVATVDVNLDGIADIITSVGVKGASQVKIYDGKSALDGTYNLIQPDRSILAYPDYPDVALWVAGSRTVVKLQ